MVEELELCVILLLIYLVLPSLSHVHYKEHYMVHTEVDFLSS